MKNFIIISNNCASAYFYRSINKQFNHPFIWSEITEKDILKAITNWKRIRWNNIHLHKEPKTNYPVINVDNLFSIKYRHYRFSAQDKEPRTVIQPGGTTDVFYCNNLMYTRKKYESRVLRMPRINPSVLLMHWGNLWECSDEVLRKIIKECQKRSLKIFIFTFRQKDKIKIKESETVKWIDIDHEVAPGRINSDIIAHSKILKDFFEK